jgi:hypothetical protein
MWIQPLPFEIVVPGNWVLIDGEIDSDLTSVTHHILSSFADAGMALILFERIQNPDPASDSRAAGEAHRQRERELESEVESEIGPGSPFDMERRARVEVEVSRRYLRERVAAGHLPSQFASAQRGLLGNAFVFAMNTIGNHMQVLSRDARLPAKVRSAANRYYKAFPGLEGIRDSAAHPEDRLRGKKKKDEPIPRSPSGGLIIIHRSFEGSTMVMTTASGQHARLEVTWNTITRACDHIQKLLNDLNWRGWRELFPRSS